MLHIKLKGITNAGIVANILPADPPHPLTLWWGQKIKIQVFQNMIMLNPKLNGSQMKQQGSDYFAR